MSTETCDKCGQLQQKVDALKQELAEIKRKGQGKPPLGEPSPRKPSRNKVCVDSSSVNVNTESSFGVRVDVAHIARGKKKTQSRTK